MKRIFLTLTLGFFATLSFGQQPTVGLTHYDSSSFDAYSLFSPFSSTETYLINNCGHIVNTWQSDYRPGAIAYLKPNGNLLRTAHVDNPTFDIAGGNGGRLEEYDWNGDLVWYMDLTTDSFSQHHDIELLPNGNILVLVWKFVSRAEALDAGKNPNIMLEDTWEEVIWEIKPSSGSGGTIVWSWSSMNHIVQDYNSNVKNYGKVSEHPELLDFNSAFISNERDWLHFNSIDYNADLDQIIISCHAFSELYIIDHSTTDTESQGHIGGEQDMGGDIIYRYGNPSAYKRGAAIDQVSFKQHDAQWIPKGYTNAGKIIFFNNGGAREYSSIDMISPTTNVDGSYKIDGTGPFGPNTPDWSYTAPNKKDFFSVNMSGVQPLPNGNMLITESTKGHLFEIDNNENIVWSYVNPINANGIAKQGAVIKGNALFRGYKYGANTAAFKNKTLLEGGRIEQDPWPIFCDDTTTTNNDTVGNSAIASVGFGQFVVYPNPAKNTLHIRSNQEVETVSLYGVSGALLASKNTPGLSEDITLDLTLVAPGIYSVVVETSDGATAANKFVKY